jgi:hypothetical protein
MRECSDPPVFFSLDYTKPMWLPINPGSFHLTVTLLIEELDWMLSLLEYIFRAIFEFLNCRILQAFNLWEAILNFPFDFFIF